MSKLTKLIRNPRQFFRDSKFRRAVLLGTRQFTFNEKVPPHASFRKEVGGGVARLIDYFAAQVPVLLVPEQEAGTSVRVGVRRTDQQYLTNALTELARQGGVSLWIRSGRSARFAVTSRRLFALDNFLTRHKSFTINLQQDCHLQQDGHGDTAKERVRLNFEFWEDAGPHWSAPRRNPVARRLSPHTIETQELFKVGRARDAREFIAYPLPTRNQLEIDIVYTWVNHRDPRWRALYASAVADEALAQVHDATSLDRFLCRDELKYSLRSVMACAPWVRRIHIVSNCTPPAWLDLEHPKIQWVDHSQIFRPDLLPTFSSHAIEARLQHVPELAEHFLYFNDDFLLARPAGPTDFYFPNGIAKSFTEEYGTVNGDVHEDDPDYMNAARNGQRLIEQHFGRTPTALHKHTPYALRRSVLLEMERTFPEAYARTVEGKFRSPQDISTVSFLYHHYAYLTGRSIYSARRAVLLKPSSTRYLDEMLQIVDGSTKALSICVNDGQGSSHDPDWNQHVHGFLEALFGEPCELEMPAQCAPPTSTDAIAAEGPSECAPEGRLRGVRSPEVGEMHEQGLQR
jgi:hypothetical protein